jgi:hypothetical protein
MGFALSHELQTRRLFRAAADRSLANSVGTFSSVPLFAINICLKRLSWNIILNSLLERRLDHCLDDFCRPFCLTSFLLSYGKAEHNSNLPAMSHRLVSIPQPLDVMSFSI